MNDVILDDQLFADFCKHISASLNATDVVYKVRQFAPSFDIGKDDPIMLVVTDPQMTNRLIEYKYPEFLQECVRRLRILPSCRDVFLSEVENETFEVFERGFEYFAPHAKVEVTDKGFIIHSPALIADLILPAIGRVHHEVLLSLNDFSRVLQALDNDPTRLFLNAKCPTPESQYIQFWVASKLNIPTGPIFGPIAVV